MKHLEEGTIHAWLDGALSAAEARDAESHVGSCVECSAMVADARGLIAGASRILTALDDVPAGVTPKRAPSTAPAIRQWRAAPWVTGIAATLMLAIGVKSFTRTETQTKAAERATSMLDSSAPDAAVTRRVVAPTAAPPALADARRSAALGEQSRRAKAAVPSQLRSASGAGAAQGGSVGFVGDSARSLKKVVADLATSQPAAPSPLAQFKEAPTIDAAAKLPNVLDLAGCYPIDQSTPRTGVVIAEATAKAATPRPRAISPAGAPTAAMNPAAAEVVPAVPPVVHLDSTSGRLGFMVREPGTRVVLGFWNRAGDSVRVDLLTRGVFTIAGTKRANCP